MRLRRFLRNRALRVGRRVASPLRRWRTSREPRVVALYEVHRRLELLLLAMYDTPVRVAPVVTAEEGDVALPAQLDARLGRDDAVARFRLLALLQGARLARGADSSTTDDPLVRDLYRLAESAAAERELVSRVPALAQPLAALRLNELAPRPRAVRLSHTERRVESLLGALLASPPERIPDALPICATPADSRAWAERTAREILAESAGRSPYRPRNPMGLWGLAWSRRAERGDDLQSGGGGGGSRPDPHSAPGGAGDRASRVAESDDAGDGPPVANEGGSADDESGSAPAAAASDDASDAGSDAGAVVADADGDDLPVPRDARRVERARPPDEGITYPEWDEYGQRMRPGGATVMSSIAESGDGGWADDVLREHAPLVRQVRDRFAPLRTRRLRLRRQRTGDELDLEACVAALTDRRIGLVPSDRLYQVVRPARHTLAILLLADTSGSTGTRLADGRTVLDVERMTLLLAGEALATMGDPYAMLAFSGAGRHGVHVRTLKGFAEHDASAVRRRISALAPRDNTRLGAAVRHAAAVLRAQPAQHRILLLLSDGKPNDVDWYQGAYAVEDSRRAILEARTGGTHTFCLTVEQEEQDYLPRLFGEHGYRVLHRPEQLPSALLEVVRGMIVR